MIRPLTRNGTASTARYGAGSIERAVSGGGRRSSDPRARRWWSPGGRTPPPSRPPPTRAATRHPAAAAPGRPRSPGRRSRARRARRGRRSRRWRRSRIRDSSAIRWATASSSRRWVSIRPSSAMASASRRRAARARSRPRSSRPVAFGEIVHHDHDALQWPVGRRGVGRLEMPDAACGWHRSLERARGPASAAAEGGPMLARARRPWPRRPAAHEVGRVRPYRSANA